MGATDLKRMLNKEISATKSQTFYVTLAVLISAVLFIFLKIAGSLGWFSIMGEVGAYVVDGAIQVMIIGLIPFYIIKLCTKTTHRQMFTNIGFKKITGKSVLYSILLGFICFVGVSITSVMFQLVISIFGYQNPFTSGTQPHNIWWLLIIEIILTAVFPALFEEVFNRGYSLWSLKRFGVRHAILISSLIFAFMHFNINQVFYTFLLGLVLANLRLASKSIWPVIIIHFINNAISVVFGFLEDNLYFGHQLYVGFKWLLFSGDVWFVVFKCIIVFYGVLMGIAFFTAKIFSSEKDREIKDEVYVKALSILPVASSEFQLARTEDDMQTLKRLGIKTTDEEFAGQTFLKMKEVATEQFDIEKLKKAGSFENFMIGAHLENFEEIQNNKKTEVLSRTFVIGTLVLGATVTFWTLVWGII